MGSSLDRQSRPERRSGRQGIQGIQGTPGTNGIGVPAGGTAGQVLAKQSNTDHDTGWTNVSGGSSDFLSPLLQAEIGVTGAVTATIGRIHVCSGTSADYTVMLPAAPGNAGKLIGFRMSAALTKLVTLDGNASELIDGASTRIMWAGESAILMCDGTGWTKIGGKSVPMVGGIYAANNQLFAAATATKIACDTVLIASAMNNVGGNRINILRPSLYTIVASLRWGITNTQSSIYNSYVYKNGATLVANSFPAMVSSNAFNTFPTIDSLSAGDYIELYGFFSAGSFTTSNIVPGAGQTNLKIIETSQW